MPVVVEILINLISPSFPGWLGWVDFSGLILSLAQRSVGFWAQKLVEFYSQALQGFVGFYTQGFLRICSLTLGQTQGLVGFQALILRSIQGQGVFPCPTHPTEKPQDFGKHELNLRLLTREPWRPNYKETITVDIVTIPVTM